MPAYEIKYDVDFDFTFGLEHKVEVPVFASIQDIEVSIVKIDSILDAFQIARQRLVNSLRVRTGG